MRQAFARENLKIIVIESIVTAGAASAALLIEAPIWAMFIGWIAYFTRGLDLRNGFVNFGCVVIGLVLGVAAASIVESLGGPPDVIEMAAVVFGVALLVLSLRFLPVFNNLLGFFLGLVTWFAAHQPASLRVFGTLAMAAAIGSISGWFAHSLQKRLTAAAVKH